MPIETVSRLLAPPKGTPQERYAEGRSARGAIPLEAHAEVADGTGRADPLEILASQDSSRLQDLIPLRYGRMSRTPFTFLRGAAAVMASDLASGPTTDLLVELCGDAHLGNFRWFKAPDRELVFDLNDFDETLPGPFEWDVKRLATSVAVCGRNNDFDEETCRQAARSAVRTYRRFVTKASELSPLDLHYYRIDSRAVLEKIAAGSEKDRKWKEKTLKKATKKNSLRALAKLTEVVDGHHVIVPDPPRVERIDERLQGRALEQARMFLDRYKQTLPLNRRVLVDRFSLVDVARKVVGVGSVGTRCLIALLEAGDSSPLFLQFKQAGESVLEPHLGRSVFEQSGQRVVEGQRLIQATSDVLLGWARWQEDDGAHVDFYFRQLWDGKGKIDVESLRPERLTSFASLCGKTLAFAHARSGDAMRIRGYLGEDETFDDAIVEFGTRYADLTERDHAALAQAIADGEREVVCDL